MQEEVDEEIQGEQEVNEVEEDQESFVDFDEEEDVCDSIHEDELG